MVDKQIIIQEMNESFWGVVGGVECLLQWDLIV